MNSDPGLDSIEIRMSSPYLSVAKLDNENSSFETLDNSFVSSFSKSSNDSSFQLLDASTSPKSQTSRSISQVISQEKINFWYTNATSLNNKMHLLEANTATMFSDIIGITETWFDQRSTAALSGFQLFRSDRKDNKTASGVCIFVRDGIQAIEAKNFLNVGLIFIECINKKSRCLNQEIFIGCQS